MFKYVKYTKVETEYTTLEFRGDAEGVNVNHFSDNNVENISLVSIKSEDSDAINALVAQQPDEINCTEIEQDEFKILVNDSAQVLRIREVVKEKLDEDMSEIINKYPLIERETWGIQYAEATKYLDSSDDSDAPFLKVLADADGSSLDDFAQAVLDKKTAFVAFSAEVFAKKRAFEKELMSKIGL